MSLDHFEVVVAVDAMYESVVMEPATWPDGAFEEWGAEMAAGSRPSRGVARELRRSIRAAVKLRDFWLDPPEGVPSDAGDWRTRVDVALGIRAWRPTLDIALEGLEEKPSEELFEETRRRFREVHGNMWMEGVSYEEWLATSVPGDNR